MKKDIKKLLNISIPIIQAPMAGVQDSALALAVSKTGALGSVPCAMLTPDKLYSELKKIQQSTDKPVNFNFFSHVMPKKDPDKEKKWKELLQPYKDELDIDNQVENTKSNRIPFSSEHLNILEEFKPPVISFHFGLPDQELLAPLKEWETKILSTATTVEEAVWLEKNGADIIIAQGVEAGGHRGMFLTRDLTTQKGLFSLLPQVVDAVSVPVIAAGGIADSTGIKAVQTLGASAVQLGTSYLLCTEAHTSAIHKQALLSKEAQHTAVTNIFTGRPARGIVNRIMVELGYINNKVPDFPYASEIISGLKQKAESYNNRDFSSLWAGENVTGCKMISASELTLQLAKEL